MRAARVAAQAVTAQAAAPPVVLGFGGYAPVLRRQVAPATAEDVWGFRVTRSMCGCRAEVTDRIDFANELRDAYRACDAPANADSDAVEACVDAAVPGTVIGGSTSPGGTVTVAPTAPTPCGRLMAHATRVHEHFHVRQTDRYARTVGGAFWREWQRLRGAPDRLQRLRAAMPAETARFMAMWHDRHEWAAGDAESYTWERRFLVDVRAALGRICP